MKETFCGKFLSFDLLNLCFVETFGDLVKRSYVEL